MYDDTEKLLISLLSTASYIPQKSNVPQILMDYFKTHSIVPEIFEKNGVKNIVVRTSTTKPRVILNGHWDTVLPGTSFEEFKNVRLENGKIYGLGACDMKGGCVAVIQAFLECYKKKIPGIILCLVGDEEVGGANGTKFLIENGIVAENVILAEPSNLQITLGQKSNIFMEIVTKGKSAHGAYPYRGENAIKNMYFIIKDLLNLVSSQESISDPEELFKATTINLGQVSGGTAKNVIPNHCVLGFDIRLNPAIKHTEIIGKISEIVDKYNGIISDSNNAHGWLLDKNSSLYKAGMAAIENVLHSKPTTIYKMGTNDGGHYASISTGKCNIVNIGPGDSTLSHTAKEVISLKDIHAAAQIYQRIVTAL